MASPNNSVLYLGVTSDIERRVFEHKTHAVAGFSAKYNTIKLVYLEEFNAIEAAIAREKQLKRWSRSKKERLIESMNPQWRDLSQE